MFGYLQYAFKDKEELKQSIYRRYYCGLCLCLKRKYGQLSRFSLNHDLTFLAMLLTSLYEIENKQEETSCILHPFQKQMKYHNEAIEYVADMTIILTYYKCKDDIEDENKSISKIYGKLFRKHMYKLKKIYPDKIDIIEDALDNIRKLEKNKIYDLDSLCKESGRLLGIIFCMKEDIWKERLYRIGDYLGRFIYVMDAYDDLEYDQKKNLFNPLVDKMHEDGFENRIYDILEMMIASATHEIAYLPLIQDIDCIENVLYQGAWLKYKMKKDKEGVV